MPQPLHVTVEDFGKRLRISWPVVPWAARVFGFAFFLVVLWGIGVMLADTMTGPGALPVGISALLVAGGALILYMGLAVSLNRIAIDVTPEAVSTRQEPLPVTGLSLPSAGIAQIYCRDASIGGNVMCHVMALMKDGRTLPACTHGFDAATALFIEQTIERHLGIEDRAVSGELPRV